MPSAITRRFILWASVMITSIMSQAVRLVCISRTSERSIFSASTGNWRNPPRDDLLSEVHAVLHAQSKRQTGVDPLRLQLEMTESVAAADPRLRKFLLRAGSTGPGRHLLPHLLPQKTATRPSLPEAGSYIPGRIRIPVRPLSDELPLPKSSRITPMPMCLRWESTLTVNFRVGLRTEKSRLRRALMRLQDQMLVTRVERGSPTIWLRAGVKH